MSQAARIPGHGDPREEASRPHSGWLASETRLPFTADVAGVGYYRYADVPFFVVYVGSSSAIYDRRSVVCAARPHPQARVVRARKPETLSVVEELQELMAALALNKSMLAKILRVSRPTIYEWLGGKEPKQANEDRLQNILQILSRRAVTGANPLNARFIRRSLGGGSQSLFDLMSDEPIDTALVNTAIDGARALTAEDRRRRSDREERLRDLGFEETGQERRRQTLARNIALLDWPKD